MAPTTFVFVFFVLFLLLLRNVVVVIVVAVVGVVNTVAASDVVSFIFLKKSLYHSLLSYHDLVTVVALSEFVSLDIVWSKLTDVFWEKKLQLKKARCFFQIILHVIVCYCKTYKVTIVKAKKY